MHHPHRQDSTYHSLCYTSRGALAGVRNSSMGPPHEGLIRRPIAPWANGQRQSIIHHNRNVRIYLTTHSTHCVTVVLNQIDHTDTEEGSLVSLLHVLLLQLIREGSILCIITHQLIMYRRQQLWNIPVLYKHQFNSFICSPNMFIYY